jgi:hypothetical protein
MRTSTVAIHNYRSICDVTVRLHDYTLLVGRRQAKLSPKAKTLALKGDIENELSIPKISNRDDVKPYHLLREYEQGNCKNVDAFCRKIEALFPKGGKS